MARLVAINRCQALPYHIDRRRFYFYCVGKFRSALPILPAYRAFERSFDVLFC